MSSTYWLGLVYADQVKSQDDLAFELISLCDSDKNDLIGFAVSPLHDDTDNDHFHLIFRFSRSVGLSRALETFKDSPDWLPCNKVLKAPLDKVARFASGYLIHKNQPDKVQYAPESCYFYNIRNVEKHLFSTQDCLFELMEIIEDNDIKEFWQFYRLVQDLQPDLKDYALKHNSFLYKLIQSRRYMS